MKKLLLIIIATTSLTASAGKLTEAEIVQITQNSQEAIVNSYACFEIGVAEGRVDLSDETFINFDSQIPRAETYGNMSYRCKGSTVWHEGESCLFVKEFGESYWYNEYCDT